jgi:hypothetical protein
VYVALTACVVGVYVLVVGYLGATFRVDGSLAISLVATGIVAVLFAPLRDRLQRGVNRLLYSERDEPYAVLSRLGQRLEAALDPKSVLPTIVETVAGALKSPHAEVFLYRDGGFETAARHGTPAGVPSCCRSHTGTRRWDGSPSRPVQETNLSRLPTGG